MNEAVHVLLDVDSADGQGCGCAKKDCASANMDVNKMEKLDREKKMHQIDFGNRRSGFWWRANTFCSTDLLI